MHQRLLRSWLIFLLFLGNGQPNNELDEVYHHLQAMEGRCKTSRFVKHGTIIATGIQLGHQTVNGLRNMGISTALIEKLKPYLGLQSSIEIQKAHLDHKALELSDEEIEELDHCFLQNSLNIVKPYSKYMDEKARTVLISLRYWTGRLSNTSADGKLAVMEDGKVVNYVWNAIQNKKATNQQLRDALLKTMSLHSPFSTAYDRIYKEVLYLTSADGRSGYIRAMRYE